MAVTVPSGLPHCPLCLVKRYWKIEFFSDIEITANCAIVEGVTFGPRGMVMFCDKED